MNKDGIIKLDLSKLLNELSEAQLRFAIIALVASQHCPEWAAIQAAKIASDFAKREV